MAGHSHSANIAHRKGAVDAKRGKLFSKLCRKIYVAAKNGGGDPAMNLPLRYAIDKARSYSCPKDNIERSIKKGTGELAGENFEEVTYEGLRPRRRRRALRGPDRQPEPDRRRPPQGIRGLRRQPRLERLRQLPLRVQGPLRHRGQARRRGPADGSRPRAGADDLKRADDYFEVTCDPKVFEAVRKALEEHKIATESADTSYLPANYVSLDADHGRRMLRLRDLLDENEDVQNVFDNAEVPEELVQA